MFERINLKSNEKIEKGNILTSVTTDFFFLQRDVYISAKKKNAFQSVCYSFRICKINPSINTPKYAHEMQNLCSSIFNSKH